MADPVKALAGLLKKAKAAAQVEMELPQGRPDAGSLLEEFFLAFMHWEASVAAAKNARRKLAEAFVDHNELRIALPHEIASAIGDRYPLVLERSLRLRAALHELYRREHAISFASVAAGEPEAAVAFVSSLEGVPWYVSCRIGLRLGLEFVPVDYRMLDLLVAAKAVPVDTASGREICPSDVSKWLADVVGGKGLKGYTLVQVYGLLQAWSDEEGESRKSDPDLGGEPLRAPGDPIRRKKVVRTKPPSRASNRGGSKRPDRGGIKPRGRG